MRTKLRGFTLIELMIAVAIVGILASIAIPSYNQYIIKGKRGEAEAALVTFANAMEQWRLQTGSYCGAAVPGCFNGSPTIFSTVVPVSGGITTYNLTISAVTATTYTLRATPTGSQASDGYLELANDGTKTCAVASACLNGNSW
jgi:type IV pilus assembly protein PilE